VIILIVNLISNFLLYWWRTGAGLFFCNILVIAEYNVVREQSKRGDSVQETNDLGEAIKTIIHIWQHRKGNEIPAAVADTIKVLWPNEPIPKVTNKYKKDYGYLFVILLPPGLSYRQFKEREQYFADSTHGAVLIEKQGKFVNLKVMTDELKNRYPYVWDWSKYDKMDLPVPFGYSAAGFIVKDLSDAPNLIVAGHPGAGKSNFLHVLAVSLLLSRDIFLIIIDLKKLEFSYMQDRALLIDDLNNARSLLKAINKELDKRLDILKQAGVVKIQDFKGDMKFIVLVIDELAEMQDKECQELLNRILRLGRAPGICVVCATQRPSSTLFQKFGDSKAMFAATICFHVRDATNSRMLLDNDAAALIPNIPGRAIFAVLFSLTSIT